MKAFAEMYARVDETTSTNEKVQAMADYFAAADAKDAIWAVALLTGRRPKRPVRAGDVRNWCNELAGIPPWLFEESYGVVGDLSETISLLIPNTLETENKSLSEMMKALRELGSKSDDEKKEWLFHTWQSLSRNELLVFNKLISGNFRVGVSAQLVYRALAKAFSADERVIAHRMMGQWNPDETTLEDLISSGAETDHSQPYPFYLAYQLDAPPETLGNVSDWVIERKYDGIRGQIIIRKQDLIAWSRGEELMTERLPEMQTVKSLLPDGTVIDGEFVGFRNDRVLPFGEMQKRTGRKNLSKKILQNVPVSMICYDLLEYQGKDIRQKPLAERRMLLESVITPECYPVLQISPEVKCTGWNDVRNERDRSRSLSVEGLMLKHRQSVYETGRRRGNWWKWKVDPFSVDAVLLYAQPGHGRRANLYTDYTFGILDNGELVPFAKAYSGLTDKEILEVDAWIKKNTIEKFGPVRSVKAELVFEIAFEGINRSTRHKSGIALRFPRIARWRKDKNKEEVNTKEDLLQLLDALNG